MSRQCDGCQLGPGEYECDDGDGELFVCPDCGYSVCDDCQVHACTSRSCTNSYNIRTVGICSCGSCASEFFRQTHTTEWHNWNGVSLPPVNTATNPLPILTSLVHHNLARGCCRCENSNFGVPYSDMCSYSGKIACYMGGRGGEHYQGPIKPYAQKKIEEMLLDRDLPFLPVNERKCYNPGCQAYADLRCSRCKSVWYCSKTC